MSAPAGWHVQPDGRERYWDGQYWTSEFRPAQQTPPPAPPPPPSPVEEFIAKPWVRFAGVGLLGVIVGGFMFGGGSSTETAIETSTGMATEVVTETIVETVTETVTAEAAAPQPAAPATSAAPVASTPTATSTATATPTEVVVPDAVGMNYQDAQDLWRSQGLIVGVAEDATGANRLAMMDRNWVVVGQDLEAGTTVASGTVITASIKKYTDN